MQLSSIRILALEPYYGGSHKAFLDGWVKHSQHKFTVLDLPPYKWKWRMRQSAPLFAAEVTKRLAAGETWDVVWASDMLALAEFRGLVEAAIARLPHVLYFHENQLTYPVQAEKERDFHFGVTNLVAALAADQVWFNSAYHRDNLLGAIPDFVRNMPDHRPTDWGSRIAAKSVVECPGVEVALEPAQTEGPLRIVWAARWEHDKGPEDLFAALRALLAAGVKFEVSVVGETFRESPEVFDRSRSWLGDRVRAWGYQESRAEYEGVLAQADVFVSTARHEYFGLAAVEAAMLGCLPVLPQRLSYPQVFEAEEDGRGVVFFDGSVSDLAGELQRLAAIKAAHGTLRRPGLGSSAIDSYRWPLRAKAMDARLRELTRSSQC